MSARVLVTYAASTGCNSNCATDIADEIAAVPDLEVDVQPMASVPSLEPYTSAYVGWVHPSTAGERELNRFLAGNAALLPSRPIWIVHMHPGCAHDAGRGAFRMTRLVASAREQAQGPAPADQAPVG